jgi:hypothetical protein
MAHAVAAPSSDDSGFLIRETDAEYREQSKTHLTSHALADFRRCPLLYWKRSQCLLPDEDRPAYALGRAAHMLILEGRERFDEQYAVGGPINPRTGKPYGANTQAFADWSAARGKPVFSDEQFALIVNMTTSVRSHPLALAILADGVPEGVVRAQYGGVPCQTRMDWFNPARGIVDLKTCDDLTWFEADARRFGYAHQMAFYRAVLECATGEVAPIHMIAVEKKEPFRCGVWLLSDDVLAVARRENEAAIERLKQCELTGAWPTGYEERRVFDFL